MESRSDASDYYKNVIYSFGGSDLTVLPVAKYSRSDASDCLYKNVSFIPLRASQNSGAGFLSKFIEISLDYMSALYDTIIENNGLKIAPKRKEIVLYAKQEIN